MSTQDVTNFTTVDHTGDPGFFLRFLDEANKIATWKKLILDPLRLTPTSKVLDIGCGMGTDAIEVAERVPEGHVTGVDFSESLIAEAIRRTQGRNLPVTFLTGDAQSLELPDHSFDAVRTERMLMHVPDAEKALKEMARVLRSGGRMVVFDFDWESVFCDSPFKETTRRIALSFCDGMKNGWIGRRLPRLFREAGMRDVSSVFHTVTIEYYFLQLLFGGHVAKMVASGALQEQEANLWWRHLESAGGDMLFGFTAFITSGTKA
jgi:ubiquinone/menaquinone biosynthesis C-methylase UbiE